MRLDKLGGALGGLFVALIAPRIFNNYMELPVGIVLCAALVSCVLWNKSSKDGEPSQPQNRWILTRLQHTIRKVEAGLAEFQLNESAQSLYEFTWNEVCDWFIEFSKLPLRAGGKRREESIIVLHHTLETLFRLMPPLMPFVTEELWQSLPWKSVANTNVLVTGLAGRNTSFPA